LAEIVIPKLGQTAVWGTNTKSEFCTDWVCIGWCFCCIMGIIVFNMENIAARECKGLNTF